MELFFRDFKITVCARFAESLVIRTTGSTQFLKKLSSRVEEMLNFGARPPRIRGFAIHQRFRHAQISPRP